MGRAILNFEHVTGKGRKFHLEDISFELMPGYICGLIGENGAGKTTLIKSVMDDKYRYKGRILIEGEDIRSNHAQIKNRIGFVSEDQRFFDELSAKQNVEILGKELAPSYNHDRSLEIQADIQTDGNPVVLKIEIE